MKEGIYSTKRDEDYFITKTDQLVTDLVYDKIKLRKAYNYYNGFRDLDQFRHLEENYGIGTPSSVKFVPLVRKHIDALVGELLSIDLRVKVSCKDKDTLSNIIEDKKKHVMKAIKKELISDFYQVAFDAVVDKDMPYDESKFTMKWDQLQAEAEANFISAYEVAAQTLIKYFEQSEVLNLKEVRKELYKDLLISGTYFFRPKLSENKKGVELEALSPMNTFIERNPHSNRVRDSLRCAIRKFLTKQEILNQYGHLMSKEDLESLEDKTKHSITYNNTFYVRTLDGQDVSASTTDGLLAGWEVTPDYYNYNRNPRRDLIEVLDCEWIDADKGKDGKYILNRYNCIKIGADIYVIMGVDDTVVRSLSAPTKCTLSVDGYIYSTRGNDPISLVVSTMDLQDRYDLLHFYQDNLFASSGTKGDFVDVAKLPTFLGGDDVERLLKWLAYKKQGFAPIDSTQEGMAQLNTIYNGYDDTVASGSIQSIQLAIESVEKQCSSITGVYREKLGGIDQKDAVSNVSVGIRQSTYVTKQYFDLMDDANKNILSSLLNLAKTAYSKGLSGVLVLGNNLQKTFSLMPKHYVNTDFDIHLNDAAETYKEEELIKQFAFELVKAGAGEPDMILEVLTSKNMTELKENVNKGYELKEKKNNVLAQLNQKVEQLTAESQELQKANEKLQKQLGQLNAEEIKLEEFKVKSDVEIEWFKAKNDAEYKERINQAKDRHVEVELAQLYDSSKKNDEVTDLGV